MGVFGVTSISSLLAYIWLFLVISVISKEYIELWEAILTLSFFFILVICAFIADKINEKRAAKKKKLEIAEL
jgi:solute carrier family 8 (sodium/calcium exchanger)